MPKKPKKKEPLDAARVWDRIRQNPGLIIAVAATFGVSATEVRALLEADVPGWVAALIGAGVPLLYATLARARTSLDSQRQLNADVRAGLTAQRELTDEVRGMRSDIRELKDGRKADGEILDDHERRLTVLERAESEAYSEKANRETGPVEPGE